MTYERAGPRFRALGMFVGFGAVEAGCKAIGQRLEQSGTHWSLPGAAAIITLRCRQASGPMGRSGGRPATSRAWHDQASERSSTLRQPRAWPGWAWPPAKLAHTPFVTLRAGRLGRGR